MTAVVNGVPPDSDDVVNRTAARDYEFDRWWFGYQLTEGEWMKVHGVVHEAAMRNAKAESERTWLIFLAANTEYQALAKRRAEEILGRELT